MKSMVQGQGSAVAVNFETAHSAIEQRLEVPLVSLRHVRAILFDHDGTTANSEKPALTSAWRLTNEILVERQLAHLQYDLQDFMDRYKGKPYSKILEGIIVDFSDRHRTTLALSTDEVEALSLREEVLAQAVLRNEVEPTDGITAALEALHQSRIPMAMVTSSLPQRIHACFERTGQGKYFSNDTLFFARNSNRPKPAPDAYIEAISNLGHSPSEFVVIEDTPTGVKAAVAANIPARNIIGYVGAANVRIEDRPEISSTLTQAGAGRVITHMSDLIDRISLIDQEYLLD